MTPAARLQAAIEVLDEVLASVREEGPPADAIVTRYFKQRRYAGSGDRRAVRELVFRAIRRTAERPDSGRAAIVGLVEDDSSLAELFSATDRRPVLLSTRFSRPPSRSTSDHVRLSISPRLAPVSKRSRTMSRAELLKPSSSISVSIAKRRLASPISRNLSLFASGNALTPCAALELTSSRSTAKVSIPPSSRSVRVATPLPPVTIARPRGLVLSSTAVSPRAIAATNSLTKRGFRSKSLTFPRSGRMCRRILPASDAIVLGFFRCIPSLR